jgi:acetyltransferase-like isoleucine patch superfamily enzyme
MVTARGRQIPGDWHPGCVPENVQIHEDAYVESSYSFLLCRSRARPAVEIGRSASVYGGNMFDLGPDARVHIGEFAMLNGARLISDAEVEIGAYALISWNVVLMDTYRVPQDPAQRRKVLEQFPLQRSRGILYRTSARPIRIGRNTWIGFDSCILPGVTIGAGSIIGARSVVTEDVPPYTIAAGNPARPVRQLEREETHS